MYDKRKVHAERPGGLTRVNLTAKKRQGYNHATLIGKYSTTPPVFNYLCPADVFIHNWVHIPYKTVIFVAYADLVVYQNVSGMRYLLGACYRIELSRILAMFQVAKTPSPRTSHSYPTLQGICPASTPYAA